MYIILYLYCICICIVLYCICIVFVFVLYLYCICIVLYCIVFVLSCICIVLWMSQCYDPLIASYGWWSPAGVLQSEMLLLDYMFRMFVGEWNTGFQL